MTALEVADRGKAANAARVLTILAAAILVWILAREAYVAALVASYPYQLDFGEGVVWQQARMIARGDGYSPLAEAPHIVFHYPPLFHALTVAVSSFTGDALFYGRLVSAVAALISAATVASFFVTRSGRPRSRPVVPIIAALLFCANPFVIFWATLMRVDFVALAFALAGARIIVASPHSRWSVYIGSLCFLLALFTKQTYIAIPAATYIALLFTNPGNAVRGGIFLGLMGLSGLAIGWALTDGGFVQHLIGYNINRIDVERGWNLLLLLLIAQPLVAVLSFRYAAGFVYGAARRIRYSDPTSTNALQQRFFFLFFCISTFMLPLCFKSGANTNYFLEWIAASTMFTVHVLSSEKKLEFWIPSVAAVLFSLAILPGSESRIQILEDRSKRQSLAEFISSLPGPVLSDEMVAVILSGKDVYWESAIHGELLAMGRWAPETLIEEIRQKKFSAIITEGRQGPLFEARWPSQIMDHIEENYPYVVAYGGFYARLPAARELGN